ncbi:hypothetical protein FOL47_001143, partial [Perkinsus chesapeaki]
SLPHALLIASIEGGYDPLQTSEAVRSLATGLRGMTEKARMLELEKSNSLTKAAMVAAVLYYTKFKVAREQWRAAEADSPDSENDPKVKAAYVVMFMQLSGLVKICCELTESTLALGYVPSSMKEKYPKTIKVIQVLCALTSATSSMHKLLMNQQRVASNNGK